MESQTDRRTSLVERVGIKNLPTQLKKGFVFENTHLTIIKKNEMGLHISTSHLSLGEEIGSFHLSF